MLLRTLMSAVLLAVALGAAADERIPLQPLIDAAEPNATLRLEPGVYAGPVVVDKPLTIDGGEHATIDAGGTGTVVTLATDGAQLRKLRLVNSGTSHNDIDSAVQVRGNFNIIKDNVIDNTLFGVDLQQSNNNIVRRNTIRSQDRELGRRGDAVRLWYSMENKIVDNVITDSRDMVVWYSAENTIKGNTTTGSRYALHFMYSRYNLVEDNTYYNNSVGIFLMYSDGVIVRNNFIAHAIGATGTGIGFKETSDVTIEGNRVFYCATGLYLDVSPYDPEATNRLHDNTIAYNGIGIRFLNDWKGNIFEGNLLKGNITQVAVNGGGGANRNVWKDNYWDDYEGFDRDHDGVGDSPHEYFAYADRLWMDVPAAQFFTGSPTLEVLDFLERLAPFSEPDLILRDTRPQMAAERADDERTRSQTAN